MRPHRLPQPPVPDVDDSDCAPEEERPVAALLSPRCETEPHIESSTRQTSGIVRPSSSPSIRVGLPMPTWSPEVSCEDYQDLVLRGILRFERDSDVRSLIEAAVWDCSFCVTFADPDDEDFPLIAVSEGFCRMTQYSRADILGKNCRFLNEGCPVIADDLMQLRISCQTGCPFRALLPNKKKDGTYFINLLDLRGLVVGSRPDGKAVWYLVGIQADVTGLTSVPTDHLKNLTEVAQRLRAFLQVATDQQESRPESGRVCCARGVHHRLGHGVSTSSCVAGGC